MVSLGVSVTGGGGVNGGSITGAGNTTGSGLSLAQLISGTLLLPVASQVV